MSDCKTLGLGPTETYIETIHIFPDTLLLSLILYARLGRLGPILPLSTSPLTIPPTTLPSPVVFLTKASRPRDVSKRNTTAMDALVVVVFDVEVDGTDPPRPRTAEPGVPKGVVRASWILGVGRFRVNAGVPGLEANGDEAGR